MRVLTNTETQEIAGGTFGLLKLLFKFKSVCAPKYEPKNDCRDDRDEDRHGCKDYNYGKKC